MKKQTTVIIIILVFLFLFTGCSSKTDVKSVDFSEEDILKISTLLPFHTTYQVYEVDFKKYSKLELICDIYSFGELLESRSVGGFKENAEFDSSKSGMYVGIAENIYNTVLISFNSDGGMSQKTIDLSDFKEINIKSLANASISTVTKTSENEYLLFLSVYNDGEQGFNASNNLDDYSDCPFYYAVRCILAE